MADPLAWMDDAACRDAPIEWFFPTEGRGRVSYGEGKLVCFACPVKQECLEWALAQVDDDYGLYGGLTPRQRRDVRSARHKNRFRFPAVCRVCGTDFTAGSSNASLCSGACRMRAMRASNLAHKQRRREAS